MDKQPVDSLTWRSKKQWGAVGNTYYVDQTLDNGDTWKFVVDQPRKGQWTARGWRYEQGSKTGDMVFYREGRTMKDAKAQCQAHINYAATQTCRVCRRIGGHNLDCAAVLPVPADADRHATVPLVDEVTAILADERTARYAANYGHASVTLEKMADASRAAADVMSHVSKSININLWLNRRRPSGCSCPTPTHRMSCGHGARPVVVLPQRTGRMSVRQPELTVARKGRAA